MNLFDNIHITLSYSPVLLAIGLILIIAYTFFIYRTTLPIISKFGKSVLVVLRILALLLVLLLLFDPTINLTSQEIVEPKNLVFVDNSKSISEFSPNKQKQELNKLIDDLTTQLNGSAEFYTFGKRTKISSNLVFDSIKFNDASTNFNSK